MLLDKFKQEESLDLFTVQFKNTLMLLRKIRKLKISSGLFTKVIFIHITEMARGIFGLVTSQVDLILRSKLEI
jgi:hypothetical protein